jgi:hypothetical protein
VTDVERMLTEIRFYEQILGDSKRTILCQPSMLDAIREVVERRGVGHIYAVRASPVCPDGKLLLLDEQAIEASFQQVAQRCARSLYR